MRFARLLGLLALAACSSNRTSNPEPPSRPQAVLTGTMPQQMRNCPSGVQGARTAITPTANGVDLTITAADPAARQRIQTLAQLQSIQRDSIGFLPPHTGLHGGPGTIGHCPIIHANTTVTFEPVPEGVRVHVAANDPGQVLALQRATMERVRALATLSS